MAKKMPKEILVYVCDRLDDGAPVYGVAINVDDIPEDMHGEIVGNYSLNNQMKFRIRRELE